MKDFIYLNFPDSGLGDRLLDLINVYTYSELLGYKNFYINWKYGPAFEATRQCLKLENTLKYIEFPNNINFSFKFNKRNFKTKETYIFKDVVGAQSLFSFMDKYINIEDREKYEKLYYEICKKFKIKNIPKNIETILNTNNITTIHLRRTDKITSDKGAFGIDKNNLKNLNEITKNFIEKELRSNNNICLISDDKEEKIFFQNLYKEENIITFDFNDQVIQTFVDFYCLVNSNKIFLSQQFSTFSVIASLIYKEKELYFPFDTGRIFDYKFNNYNNIKYYKND